jgi:predicted transcriptional regulator
MRVLWDKRLATVGEIIEGLRAKERVHYSTVQTTLRILESKGYVAHEKSGRAFTYRPLVDQQQARRRALRHLVSRLFNNSPSQLVMNVLEDERIAPDELQRVKRLIKESE